MRIKLARWRVIELHACILYLSSFKAGSRNVEVMVSLSGFDTSDVNTEHGFHIHAGTDEKNRCSQTQGHYNPFNKAHGAPSSDIRYDD